MFNRIKVVAGLVCVFMMAGASGSVATESMPTEKGLTPAVVEQADLINKLIDLGDLRKDPILLLAAAKLQKTMSKEAVPASTKSHASKDVLMRAKEAAHGRKDISGIVDDIAAMKPKGFCNGGFGCGGDFRNREMFSR